MTNLILEKLNTMFLQRTVRCLCLSRGLTTSGIVNNKSTDKTIYDYSGNEKFSLNNFTSRLESEAPSFLRAFAKRYPVSFDLFRYDPMKFTMKRFRAWRQRNNDEADILSQSFVEERHKMLGSDLATAHFVVFRGGKVKMVGDDRWIKHDNPKKPCPDLPDKYDKRYFVEAIDMSNTGIRYEGLANFVSLTKLKWLRFADCPFVDNWFMDFLSGEVGNTVEYLDMSRCTNLSEGMLSCMYRFTKLKELVLTDVVTTSSFQYGCLLLEDCIPQLKITGVKYMDCQKTISAN